MNQTYIVKPGDTLYGISNQFGVSVTELAELNNIKGDFLQVGRVLMIPLASGTNPNNMFMYTVKAGDTLYSIAKKYNTTYQEIINLNYLKTPNLYIGQVLRIPEMYTPEDEMFLPTFKNYTVKRGDTLYSIALSNNINPNILMQDNGLTSNALYIGQVLKIRTPSNEYNIDTIEECYGPDYTPSSNLNNYNTYTVVSGDSLYSISKRFNTSVDEIKRVNNLNNNILTVGQVLKIPNSSLNNNNTYIVKKGDTLYSIASKNNTSVSDLINKNKLTSSVLSIGQELII